MAYKANLNSICNSVLFLAMCAVVGTGLALELRLDEDHGSSQLFGMSADDWGEVHFAIALFFVALFIVHGILHRSWIKMKLQQHMLSTLMVLASGVLLVTVILVWPENRHRTSNTISPATSRECDD